MRCSFSRKMFTLVELLITISIIGILASLLAPSLQRALEQGRSVVCINNNKQINFVMKSYAEDYSGWLPAPRDSVNKNGYLMTILQSYEHGDPASAWASGGRVMSSSFICPSDTSSYNYVGNANKLYQSYKQLGAIYNKYSKWAIPTGSTNYARHQLRLSMIARPSSTGILSEGHWPHWGDGMQILLDAEGIASSVPVYGSVKYSAGSEGYKQFENEFLLDTYAHLRHFVQTGLNLLYVDGHASSFSYPRFDPSFMNVP